MIYILGFEIAHQLDNTNVITWSYINNFTSNVYVYSVSHCITTDLAIFQIVQSQYGQASS